MRRQFLSLRKTQGSLHRLFISGIIYCAFCLSTITAQNAGDTTSSAGMDTPDSNLNAVESSNESTGDELITTGNDTESSTVQPGGSNAEKKPSETVIKAGKPSEKGHRFRKLLLNSIQFTGNVLRSKLKDPLEKVSLISVHRKKIFFFVGSVIVILFTVSYYRKKREQGRFLTTTRLSIMDKEVQRACRFIEEHYEDPECNLRCVCAALVTGEAFLDALFVKELGISIADFIDQVRINRAKITMRKEHDCSPESLALSVGYSDAAIFLLSFKKITGTDYPEYKNALTAEVSTADV